MRGSIPRADAVVRLGAAGFVAGLSVGPEEALPIYVRDEVCRGPGGDCHATAIIPPCNAPATTDERVK